ncbi:MAG TPA: hypothetical protein VNW54_14570 [Granulicella sp.]|jgi:hypothetical protein|nr:hypothetical protein [Granulicella sp.]
MEIYLKHPWVVWATLGPIALVFVLGTLAFLAFSFLPSSSVERLVNRYLRRRRV